MKISHYFISWHGFNKKGLQITYGFKLTPFTETKAIKEIENDIEGTCLKSAIKGNPEVVSVHILAFNQV